MNLTYSIKNFILVLGGIAVVEHTEKSGEVQVESKTS